MTASEQLYEMMARLGIEQAACYALATRLAPTKLSTKSSD
jgi:hypothetical protein